MLAFIVAAQAVVHCCYLALSRAFSLQEKGYEDKYALIGVLCPVPVSLCVLILLSLQSICKYLNSLGIRFIFLYFVLNDGICMNTNKTAILKVLLL